MEACVPECIMTTCCPLTAGTTDVVRWYRHKQTEAIYPWSCGRLFCKGCKGCRPPFAPLCLAGATQSTALYPGNYPLFSTPKMLSRLIRGHFKIMARVTKCPVQSRQNLIKAEACGCRVRAFKCAALCNCYMRHGWSHCWRSWEVSDLEYWLSYCSGDMWSFRQFICS